jgi:hypothetical protein
MKKILEFDKFLNEYYDPSLHRSVNLSKKIINSRILRSISYALSILVDIIHFDYKSLKNTFNRQFIKDSQKLTKEKFGTSFIMPKNLKY